MSNTYTKEKTKYPNAFGIALIILFSILSAFIYLIVAAILDRWLLPEAGFKHVSVTSTSPTLMTSQVSNKTISSFINKDPVIKSFKGRLKQIKHLAYDYHTKGYACTCCGVTFSNAQQAQKHFSQNLTAHNQTSKHHNFRNVKNLKDQVNALTHLLNSGNCLTSLDQTKRKYADSYATKTTPGLFPGFLTTASTIPPKASPANPVSHFYTLLQNGHILTKSFPEMYGDTKSQQSTFQGIPTSFLSIFNQLTDQNYKPTPRDQKGRLAHGAGNPNKWVFNHQTSSWNCTQVRPKIGKKQPKPYMQKNSTTLASPGGNHTFGGSNYATAIAYDANKSKIDDQYTWRKNAVTAEKWWYGLSPAQKQNPSSFLGIQLQNLFCTADNTMAPQNEILARPNIDSVVATIAITDTISAKLTSFLQAKYINTFINGQPNSVNREVPTLFKNAHGQYVLYKHKDIAEHIIRLFFSYRVKSNLSLSQDENSLAADALRMPKRTISKLYQKLGVTFLEQPIKDALHKLTTRLDRSSAFNINTTTLKEWINAMPTSYTESYPRFIVADYINSKQLSNNAKVASGANADIVKSLLRDATQKCLSGNKITNQEYSVIIRELRLKRKIWRSRDVINAFCIFTHHGNHPQKACILNMVKSMTTKSFDELLSDPNMPLALFDYIDQNAATLNLNNKKMTLLENKKPSTLSRFFGLLSG